MVQDSLARMVEKFKRANGAKSFPYLPKTYLLPDDRDKVQTPVSVAAALRARACWLDASVACSRSLIATRGLSPP